MPQLGVAEILIVVVIALLVFGPDRLTEVGRSLGTGFKEFKNSLGGKTDPPPPKGTRKVPSSSREVEPEGPAPSNDET